MPYIAVKLATDTHLTIVQTEQLVQGITHTMVSTLHKKQHLVAISVEYVPMQQWFIAEQTIQNKTAFIEVYITEGTNSQAEIAKAQNELYQLLQLHGEVMEEASYIVIHTLLGTHWGYAGKTQSSRYTSKPILNSVQYSTYIHQAHELRYQALKLLVRNILQPLFKLLKYRDNVKIS